MKFAPIAGLLLISALVGCGTPGMPLPPSLELPVPAQDLRASRKGDTVTLVWTVARETTDRTTVRLRHLGPTRVCRSFTLAMTKCTDQVAEVDTAALLAAADAAAAARAKAANTSPGASKLSASKAAPVMASSHDTLPRAMQEQNPAGFIYYAVEALNTRGRSAGLSNQVQVPLAPTLPAPALHAQVTDAGIVLSLTGVAPEPTTPELRHVYRIYRQEKGSATPVRVGEVNLTASQEGELVDHSFQWQNTYQYWVTVATIVSHNGQPSAEVEGDNSSPVTVAANDIYPPAVPAGLQAVFSGVGQQPFVDLTWAPNTDPDLAGYNLYRREDHGDWVRINSDLVPTPAYRDGNVAAGRTYFYAVTAVDVHGNESARSQEAAETVPSSP